MHDKPFYLKKIPVKQKKLKVKEIFKITKKKTESKNNMQNKIC